MLIQILLLLCVGTLLIVFVRSRHGVRLQASKRIGFVLFLIANVYGVLRPEDVTRVAHLLGVGRGADLVLYALVAAFTFAVINFYLRQRELNQRITELARAVALRDAEQLNRERGLLTVGVQPQAGGAGGDRPIAVVRQEQSRREAMSLVVESPPLPADSRSSAPSSRGWRVWTAATVLCWLVPVATHLLGIDAVLPVVIWLGTASLLRSGRSLLDRVMLAAALLAGLVGPAGLLFSVWPWGLHPVPVAGVALTGLVVVSAVTGRRPQLPWAGGVADVVTVAAALGVTGLVAWPLLHMSATGRLARFMLGEDIVRHFTVFDTIRRVGGYLYFHQDVAATTVQHGIATYPQGSHIATALLDNFVRSSTAAGSSLQAFEHYLWFYVAAFGFLVLSVLWAIRWVAGPSAAGWSFVPLAALGAGYLFLADGLPVFLFGFVSQIAAMALLASLIAVLGLPLRDLREQVLLVTALVVALSMTYYLFLLSAGVVVVIWVIRYRHRLAPARRWLAMV